MAKKITGPKLDWRPMDEAPHDRPILARGPSGYNGHPHRYSLVKWRSYTSDEYKHTRPAMGRWDTHSDDDVTDGGAPMTEWIELPS